MGAHSPSVRRARRQRGDSATGYFVTWDVNSQDRAAAGRLQRFVFGYTLTANGKSYQYPGFVEQKDVRYVGQSVLFMAPYRLPAIRSFLHEHGIPHVVVSGSFGSLVSC